MQLSKPIVARSIFSTLALIILLALPLLIEAASAQPSQPMRWNPGRPDGHAPIGVMGDHTHNAGEFMLSYRYMFMDMNGNRIGTNKVSNQRVLEDFMVTPTDMTMQMHMFGLMYAPTDYITLMGMIPYVKKSMNHLTRMGTRFRTETDGIGDIKFTGLIKIFDNYRQRVHLNAGMSFPAPVIGFNVRANAPARNAANQKGVEIRYYSVIYDLVDDVKAAASGLLSAEVRENFIGYAEIKDTFRVTGVGNVAGCLVTEGVARRSAGVRLLRDNVVIHEGTLKTLKRFKDEVKEVQSGQECGMAFENYDDIRKGDVIEIFEREEVERSLA